MSYKDWCMVVIGLTLGTAWGCANTGRFSEASLWLFWAWVLYDIQKHFDR